MATRGFSSPKTNQFKKLPKRLLVDMQTNTENEFYSSKSIISDNTSVDVIKYFQALNYINEIHVAINDDIRRLQPDKCAGCCKTLPVLPNYLSVLATFNFNEQTKCGNCMSRVVTPGGSETKEEVANKTLGSKLTSKESERELTSKSNDGLHIIREQAPQRSEINDEGSTEKNCYQNQLSFNQMGSTKTILLKRSKQTQVAQVPVSNMIANLSDLELDRYASELLLPPKKFGNRQEANKAHKSSQVNSLPTKTFKPQLQLIHSAGDSVPGKKPATKDKCLDTNNHRHVSMTIQKLNDTFRRLSNGTNSPAIPKYSSVIKRMKGFEVGEGICLGKRDSECSVILSDKEEQSADSDIEEDSDDLKTVYRSSALGSSCSMLTYNAVQMIADGFNRRNNK